MTNGIEERGCCFLVDALRAILFLCAISLLATCPGFAVSAGKQETKAGSVKVEYDEQKDVTRITLNPMILISRKYEELRLGAMTSYKGRVKQPAKEIALILISLSTADANKYESARKLTVVADDQRLPLGEAQWSKQSQNGLFMESMLVVVPVDTFLRICQAKDVTMKLGFTEVRLSAAHITMLRAAGSYMTQQ